MNRFPTVKLLAATALGALALGSLTGLALAENGSHRSEKRHGHHHGHRHHQPSGTIQSFDPATGKLTIALLNDETVNGLVDRGTKIRCEDEHAPDVTASRLHLRHGEAEPGDDRGRHGKGEPGDDRGPSGHDDNGRGANCTTSDLLPGATVLEAELEIEHGGAFFEEVELAD